MVKVLPVSVFRSDGIGDCTNGGISARENRLYLISDEGFLDVPETDSRLIRLETKRVGGREYFHVRPVNASCTGKVGPMMGGNFVYSSDSRFPADYPLPIHDRYETPQESDWLSR